MKYVITLLLIALISVACSGETSQQVTPQQVIDAFKSAGLEAESPSPMTDEDYGVSPVKATEGTRFLIPSLGEDSGGRVMRFDNLDDLKTMETYYTSLGESPEDLFFSWVFIKDNILVQINGSLPEDQAKQYETALNSVE